MNLHEFLAIAEPERNRWTVRTIDREGLFPADETSFFWATIKTRLSDPVITAALEGQKEAGYFARSVWRKQIVFDLDFHKGTAWQKDGKPSFVFARFLRSVVEATGMPSIAVRTPRGAQYHFALLAPVPLPILEEAFDHLKAQIKLPNGCGLELLPTMKHSVRIPNCSECFDAFTFETVSAETFSRVCAVNVFADKDVLPTELRKQIRQTTKLRRSRQRIEALEKALFPIHAGESNTAFCKLAAAYKLAGMKIEEALQRFVDLLWSSGYRGELLDEKRLRQRMASTWQHVGRSGPEKELPSVQLRLHHHEWIRLLTERHPFAAQRTPVVARFLERLFQWVSYQEDLDQSAVAVWTYLYRGFKERRKAGFFPLPYNVLRQWAGHHQSLVEWLERLGVLIRFQWINKRGLECDYSPPKVHHGTRFDGQCRFYRIPGAFTVPVLPSMSRTSSLTPWEEEGISRATWYRRKEKE